MNDVDCPRCGSKLREGTLLSSEGVFFVPSRQMPGRFGLKRTIHVNAARACPTCGYVELRLRPSELQAAFPGDDAG